MRLWSIHPKYLDKQGLGGAWREGLLAQNVLLGNTKGYRNHPQLTRFKNSYKPLHSIGAYLNSIFLEAKSRGYKYNYDKILHPYNTATIPVTTGQIKYEMKHLIKKLEIRSPDFLERAMTNNILLNEVFYETEGPIELWERV